MAIVKDIIYNETLISSHGHEVIIKDIVKDVDVTSGLFLVEMDRIGVLEPYLLYSKSFGF